MTKQSYFAIIALIVVLVAVYGFISSHPAGVTTDDSTTPPPSPSTKPPLYVPHLNATDLNAHWNELLTYADAPPLGSPNAEYTLIEIGDFQCPQCGRVHLEIENLIASSHGKANLYFINFPLQMHPHAPFAARAALAAAQQGKFWQMYNVLYDHQDELIPSEIQYYSGQEIPGFNVPKYLSDVSSSNIAQRVSQQVHEVQSLDMDSTPTILVRKSSGGTPVWYIGKRDTADTFGLDHLASKPPWAGS